MIEEIVHNDEIISIIVRSQYRENGIKFFTPPNFSQQLAYMNRPAGYKIVPHVHNKVKREVFYTQEVLFVRCGKIKVSLFSPDQVYIESIILEKGDVILLAAGGHGIEMIEQAELIEVKQGPYAGDEDKRRFDWHR
jgi:mannose-6-phosphate isomerase-like protein (cupin superfamily)